MFISFWKYKEIMRLKKNENMPLKYINLFVYRFTNQDMKNYVGT
jgi:hypothetical protein